MGFTKLDKRKKFTLKLPKIPANLNKVSKKTANNLQKSLAIFEAAGTAKSKKELTRWGENRTQWLRTLFYMYLFNKYKNSCVVNLTPDCDQLSELCIGSDIIFSLIYFDLKNAHKQKSYKKYQREFAKKIIDTCLTKKNKIVVVPTRIYFEGYGKNKGTIDLGGTHANLLIFRSDKKIIEVFEPHGQTFGNFEGNDIIRGYGKFVDIVNEEFRKHKSYKKGQDYIYKPSNVVCPVVKGLQSLENNYSTLISRKEEGGGYCSVWSMFMAELILANPKLDTSEILDILFKMLYDNEIDEKDSKKKYDIGTYLHSMIRGYATFITRKVEKYNKIVFGDGVFDALKLGKKYYNRENRRIIRNKFKMYLDIEYYLILNDITPEYLLENLDTKYYSLVIEYYDSDYFLKTGKWKAAPYFIELLEAMIKQNKKAYFTPIMEPKDEEKMVMSLKYRSPCPPGKVRNPKTGRCIKEKPVKAKKVKAVKTKKVEVVKAKKVKAVKTKKVKAVKNFKVVQKTNNKVTCGINPSSGRCKIGMPNDKKCKLNLAKDGAKNCTKVIKRPVGRPRKKQPVGRPRKKRPVGRPRKNDKKKKFKLVMIKDKKSTTCGINPSSGRCKIGMPNDKQCKLSLAKYGRKNCSKVNKE